MEMIEELHTHRTYGPLSLLVTQAVWLKGTFNSGVLKESTGFAFHLLPTSGIWRPAEVAPFSPLSSTSWLKEFYEKDMLGGFTQ